MATRATHRILIGALLLVAFTAPVAALLLTANPATSTTDLMVSLPAYQKYKCALCHASSTPTAGSSALNAFGRDFLVNDKIWDKTLALLNSDEDRCLNGLELGDQDGDGVFDYAGQVVEHSNPGDGTDCSIALTIQTWGKIKEVFRSELPNFFEEGNLDYDGVYSDPWPTQFP